MKRGLLFSPVVAVAIGLAMVFGAARAGSREQPPVHHQRRALELELGARPQVLGLEAERQLQLAEVARVDLIERRIARGREITAIGRPLADLGRPLTAYRHGRDTNEQCQHGQPNGPASG